MRFTLTVILLWCSLTALTSCFAQDEILTHEQQAAATWVLDESSVPLTEDQASAIVAAVYRAAEQYSLDPHHILAMMRVESRFNPKARSSENARGLMQVIPRWHRKELAKRSPYDPMVSIEVGTAIYNECLQKYSGNTRKAANCYSGGGGNKYYRLIEQAKKKLMHHVIVQLFEPLSELVASH